MKRTEAIEWLEVMKENAIFEQYDALKMAIEALQITETPTDLVSRADVVKEFIKLFCCIKDVLDIEEWKDICQTTVREVPSAKTPNNTQTDLISRADAIEAIYACHSKGRQNVENPKFHYGNWTHGLYDAICAVKNCEEVTLPSTQGEWIKTVDGNGWNDWYVLKCPFCGAIIEDKHYHSWEYNFCPHCGADVRGLT